MTYLFLLLIIAPSANDYYAGLVTNDDFFKVCPASLVVKGYTYDSSRLI